MIKKIDTQLEKYDEKVGSSLNVIHTNAKGQISLKDLETAFRSIKHAPPEEIVEKLGEKLDVDKDGFVVRICNLAPRHGISTDETRSSTTLSTLPRSETLVSDWRRRQRISLVKAKISGQAKTSRSSSQSPWQATHRHKLTAQAQARRHSCIRQVELPATHHSHPLPCIHSAYPANFNVMHSLNRRLIDRSKRPATLMRDGMTEGPSVSVVHDQLI